MTSQPEPVKGTAVHVLTQFEIGPNFIDRIDGLLARLRGRLDEFAVPQFRDSSGLPVHALEQVASPNLDTKNPEFFEFCKEFIPELIAAVGTKIIHRCGGDWKLVPNPHFGQQEPWVRDAKGMWYPVFWAANLYNETEEGISVEALIDEIICHRQAAPPYVENNDLPEPSSDLDGCKSQSI